MSVKELKFGVFARNCKRTSTMSTSSLTSCISDGTASNGGTSNPSCKETTPFDKCPRCMVQYDFLRRTNSSKVPLILNCKHIVCEDCIKRLCLANATFCPVCKEKFTVLRTQIDMLTELFQPHFALIGQLVWCKNSPNKKNINWISTGVTLRNRQVGDLQELSLDSDVKSEAESEDSDFEKQTLSLIFDKCTEHVGQYINIFCEDCNNINCCYCFLEYHGGHIPSYLYKLTDTEMKEMEKLKTDVEVILAQLLVSKKRVKELKTFDSSHVDLDIKNYFSDLHAKLHLAERNIRKKLSNMESEESDLELVTATLKSGIYRVTQIMHYFNMLDSKELNVRALYEEAQEIRDIPCRLVSDQGVLRPIEFMCDNLFDDIEDNICLKSLPPIDYSLLPIEDWSHAQEMYELNQMKRKSEPPSPIEAKPEGRLPIFQPRKKTEPETRVSNEVGKIRVVVTHLNDLNSFYVQKYSALDSLKEMNINIGKRGKRRNGNEEFQIGTIYGVLYKTKNANYWRRGKLLDIIDKEPNDRVYRMFFIDYGNTQLVTREKLKDLDLRTLRRPPFAFECKLTNPDKICFDANTHLLLPQIIGEKELYIHFMRTKQSDRFGVQEVDLLVATSNGGFISVRDLISKSPLPPVETNETLATELKLFKNSKHFSIGQEVKVAITHIRDPFYICVQLVENLKILEKMKSDMEKFYQDMPIMSCIPVEGTDVVVRYEDERQGNWHRAKITSVNIANKQVGVHFVDWGGCAQVSWSSVKLLTEYFIKVECQGIIIKLAHIQKQNSSEPWTQEAIEFLRQQIASEDQCRMVVSSVDPLEVALFQSHPAADLCLNSLLVEYNYVTSTGSISQTIYWPNMLDGEIEEDADLSFQMIKKSEEIIMEDDDDTHLRTGLKLQVDVIHVESPDLIFIKFTKFKGDEEQMHKDIQIHYGSRMRKNKNSWAIGEHCVVYDSKNQTYYRATITLLPKAGNYLVYIYDQVRELTVAKQMIFVLEPYFKRYPCFIHRCRLSHIKPAGDAGKWSNLAVEMLQKIFKTYKTVYMKKVEANITEKMFGVIMWYCLTTPAKALEPSKLKFISINQALIESGVAFSAQIKMDVPNSEVAIEELHGEVGQISHDDSTETEITENKLDKEKPVDWYEMIREDEQLLTTSAKTWPKPFKLQKTEFNATLTCVDSAGHFSVRDEEMESVYQEMESNVTANLNSLQVDQGAVVWRVNDMCTISEGGRWYRGTVLEILNDNEVSVEMIDFGSEHVVNRSKISQCIMFPDFPPFVNKLQLYDVSSKYGSWTPDDVTELLEIVTDQIKVVIKGDLDAEIPFAEIYLENCFSVNDLITQKCPHMQRLEKKVILGTLDSFETPDTDNAFEDNEETNSREENSYFYHPLPQPVHAKHKMYVVNVLKWANVYNVVLSATEPTLNSKKFISFNDDIQKQVKEQPGVEKIEINKPCACLHPQKNLWSRAVVHNIDSLSYGFVLAFFVDYGTVEMVSVGNLKEMRPDWFDCPVSMRIAAINVELVDSSQTEYVLMQMNNLRGKYVLTKVVSETPLKVHLYHGNKFCYQNFVDCGILKAL